jgi:hypothetical protein
VIIGSYYCIEHCHCVNCWYMHKNIVVWRGG